MRVPSPEELIAAHGQVAPEALAQALGLRVKRLPTTPLAPGITILSEYQPHEEIILYLPAITARVAQTGEPRSRLEQWLIAHELYHALEDRAGVSPWRAREAAADLWADEMLAVCG